MKRLYTGICWKHHVAEHFNNETIKKHTSAGKGATVFTNYEKMLKYLKDDGRKWYICELELNNEELIYEFGNDYMATIPYSKRSKDGFRPLNI